MLHTFRRLQWRMTFSYILVTIPAMVLIQAGFLVLIGGAFYAFLNSQLLAEEQATALAAIAPQVTPYLLSTPSDQAGLSQWLHNTTCGTLQPTMFPENTHPTVLLTTVVDASGRVLADATGALRPGAMLADQLDRQATQVLRAALEGQTTPATLALRQPDNAIVAATPIKDADQRVVGAWFVNIAATRFFTRNESLIVLVVFLVPLSILASFFAIVLGAIYGYLTSRNLVQRLRSLSSAADAWSAGDFSVVALDRAKDELGNLSRRLNHMAEQLQSLVTTRQEFAKLEERNRLARDLHDSVKQQLFAISMQLASARTLLRDQAPADGLLAHAESLTQAAQQEVTATIHALRPAALNEIGLVEALRAYAAEWSQQYQIAAEVRCRGQRELPLAVEQILFRVAQEALANAARHSQATQVTIQIIAEPHSVTLTIADNGRGFHPQTEAQQGIGLQSMRERVAASGGALAIESRPGEGSRIAAHMPLKEQLDE
jgi:two-component system, NarL family, sensor histidine kinase LiaS